MEELTPKRIVEELDKYIVGQHDAKKAVAVALRNRYRRKMIDKSFQAEIIPKNILMVGPTGVGKTEIARRLAKLVKAPFVKVEATKFTEVGYVGRDVESIIRDLLEASIRTVKEEKNEILKEKATSQAEKRLLNLLVPPPKRAETQNNQNNPFSFMFPGQQKEAVESKEEPKEELTGDAYVQKKIEVRKNLKKGLLEEEMVEIEVDQKQQLPDGVAAFGVGNEGGDLGQVLGSIFPNKKKLRKVTVRDARKILEAEELSKMVDMDEVTTIAIERAEESGIVFIDEIDKIAAGNKGMGPDVSREGVQRDILPIVEGSTVNTKYGPIKTDYILFIAAGAFHVSKPSDLIPELQGRFPIRVELKNLEKEDFKRILKEPKNAILTQYKLLIGTEDIEVIFTDDAIDVLSEYAYEMNERNENIGARRLYTILEKVMEDISFNASEMEEEEITIDKAYVEDRLGKIIDNKKLSDLII